jgi:hypothetical protein
MLFSPVTLSHSLPYIFHLTRLPLTKSSLPQIRTGGSDLPSLACVRVVIKSKEVFHGEERVCEVRLVNFCCFAGHGRGGSSIWDGEGWAFESFFVLFDVKEKHYGDI